MRYWLLSLSVLAVALIVDSPASADTSLQLRPLEYRESLKKGEIKKGFLDITNPLSVPSDVSLTVQGFRQVNSNGELSFYDDEQIRSGIMLDYSDVQIPAKKTLRLYFIIDGSKLPTGDVFAAIFAQNTFGSASGAAPSVRLGTLLLIENDTSAIHRVAITKLDLPWINVGESVRGSVSFKNTAPTASSNGFFPNLTLNLWPSGASRTVNGPLVYSGIEREVRFQEFDNRFGIFRLSASHEGSQTSRWIVVVTGVWRWILIVAVVTTAISLVLWGRLRRYRARRRRR